jgi:hypothetical protein
MKRDYINDEKAWRLEMQLKLEALEKYIKDLNTFTDVEGVKYITGYKQEGKIGEPADC